MGDVLTASLEVTPNIDIFIGKKLRIIRQEMGATIMEIAKKANVSMQLIQKYETGATRIPVSVLCRIADALNTEPTYFLEGYNYLKGKESKQKSLSVEKSGNLNILLVSDMIEIDYLLQKVSQETKFLLSVINVNNDNNLYPYADKISQLSDKLPMPDIIIYDLPFSKKTIRSFVRRVRYKPFNIEAPIIIISADSDIKTMQNAYRDGAAGYIYRNNSIDTLYENLKKLVIYWADCCNLAGTVVN